MRRMNKNCGLDERKELTVRRAILIGILLSISSMGAIAAQTLSLAGRVVDPQDGPVAGAEIQLTSTTGSTSALTDAQGRFTLSGIPAGSARLRIEAAGFQPHKARLDLATDRDDLVIRLRLAVVEGGELLVTSTSPELTTEVGLTDEHIAESGRPDLVEVFRGVPGLGAIRRGAINLEPVVRGLQEDQIGLFVDGTRTFAAGPARMDSNLSHIGPHAAGDVRVIKGPYALSWGAGALSAIEVDTFQPAPGDGPLEWNGALSSRYSENTGAIDAHAGVWGRSERMRFYVGAGRRAGDDYEAGDGTQVPGDYESTDTRWRFDFKPGEAWWVEVTGGYQEQQDLDFPGRLLDATYFYARSHAVELTWAGEGTVSEVYGQIYSNRKDHRMNNDEKPTALPNPNRVPPFAIAVDLPTESNTTGGRFRIALDRDAFTWTFGVDGYQLEQRATRTISRRSNGVVLFEDRVWPDAEIENLGGWGQVVHRASRHQLAATVRLDTVDARADHLSPFFLANTVGSPSQSETHVSAAVSAMLELDDHWSLSLGVGRAVRTASVLERYSDRFPATKFQLAAELMGNPELDPEVSLQLDVGTRATFGDTVFELAGFYRQIDDYITMVADPTLPKRLPLSPPTVFRYVNGSRATFYGAELLLNQRLSRHFIWRGTLSYTWAEDEALNEPILGIAPLHGELGARFFAFGGRLWVDAELELADRQDRVATSRFEKETPGYSLVNLAAALELARGWTLEAGVDNLGDRAYAQHLGSPNPFTGERILEVGRNVRLGLRLEL